jgi:hypothetical protein
LNTLKEEKRKGRGHSSSGRAVVYQVQDWVQYSVSQKKREKKNQARKEKQERKSSFCT